MAKYVPSRTAGSRAPSVDQGRLELGLRFSDLFQRANAIWIADAHREGKRFIVQADEKLTAFLELECADFQISLKLRFASRIKMLNTRSGSGADAFPGSFLPSFKPAVAGESPG